MCNANGMRNSNDIKGKSMNTNKTYVTLILFLLIIVFLSCSDDKKISFEDKLQNVLDNGIKKYGVNGVSAALNISEDKKWIGLNYGNQKRY